MADIIYKMRIWLAYYIMPKDTRKYLIKALSDNIKEIEKEITELFDKIDDNKKLSWLGKNCKDCGNEKCKKLGTLPKGHDCALWQPKVENYSISEDTGK